ncbi:MAG: hypothetical protein RIR01_2238, partial [Bacteroidota bacterium]|jgi:hypothetical protein
MADQQLNIKLNAIDNASKALTDVKNNIKGLGNTTDNVASSFFTLKNAILAFATGTTVKAIIDTTKTFQDLRSNLISATGSIQAGTDAFKYLVNFSKQSTFSVEDLTKSFLTLYSNGVQPTERLLNVFTKTSGNAINKVDTLNDLTRLFARGTQGGFGIQALQQLVANGVPVFDILEKKLGLNKDAIMKMSQEAGSSKIILDALLSGLEERASKSADRVDNLSTRLDALYKNLQNALFALGDTKALNTFIDSMNSLFSAIQPLINEVGALFVGALNILAGAFNLVTVAVKEYYDWQEILKKTISGLLAPFKMVTDYIEKSVVKAFNTVKDIFQKLSKAYTDFKESIMGKPVEVTVDQGKLPELPKVETKDISEFEKILNAINIQLGVAKSGFDSIYTTIGKTVVDGVKGISKSLAEAIVLGKSLNETFKTLAQNILVNLLQKLIEEQLIRLGMIAIEQLKLFIAKQQTQEIVKQNALLAQRQSMGGGGGGFLGSLFTMGFNLLAGGGSVPLDAPNLYNPVGEFAEGGAVRGGMPITVGERGRELFIPSSNGTIVPNHDLSGGNNITFNIQANDVRGIKELLIDNRATIINLVNQGANAKGKSNVV